MSHEIVVKNYNEMFDFLNCNYEEVNGYDFYRSIFPHNQNEGELTGDYSRPNAIIYMKILKIKIQKEN